MYSFIVTASGTAKKVIELDKIKFFHLLLCHYCMTAGTMTNYRHFDESRNTLVYADRAKNISNKVSDATPITDFRARNISKKVRVAQLEPRTYP